MMPYLLPFNLFLLLNELYVYVCEKVLQVKMGKYGKFISCSGFPDCRYTFDLRN